MNQTKNNLYLGIGANGTAKGTLKIPDNFPIWSGKELRNASINLIVGGQTTIPIKGVSVSEGMKSAFNNIDVYLGAMAETQGKIFDARAWVLIPRVIQTNFKYKKGWGLNVKLHNKLGNWNWESKGVTPVVQNAPRLFALQTNGQVSADIDMTAYTSDETPYILLSFDKDVTEEEVKSALKIAGKTIYWSEDGETDSAADVNAASDIMMNNNDGKEYYVVLLRVKSGETYHIDAGSYAFEHEEASVTPFEKLNLMQSADELSGAIDYSEKNTKYVLRTYFANAEGETEYLIDEQELDDCENIHVPIPKSGALAPTGEYYVTSFLMTEKQADINDDGKTENALIAIGNQSFADKVSYTNVNEPAAPGNVSLKATGNEVMHAKWDKVDDADGYAVSIYQEEDNQWVNTDFGYDLEANTTEVDMALTVGGNGVNVNENGTSADSVPEEKLSADKNYKIGVKAYKKVDNGKYYSLETESADEYLPKYTPVDINLSVNDTLCTKDENGIYHAYVGGGSNHLTVTSSNENATFTVKRMDTNSELSSEYGSYEIPEFEGSLIFQIDGVLGQDVTSEYVLINVDKEPPVLTLSSDVFYANKESGKYQVTGTTDAGSTIIYEDDKTVTAGSDGKFTISGQLDENEVSDSLILFAQDSSENMSKPQLALITKQTANSVTVNNSYAQHTGSGEYNKGETVTINVGKRNGYKFKGWTSDSEITFADEKSETTTFIMTDKKVSVTAQWKKSGGYYRGSSSNTPPRYTVSFDTNGGSALSSQTVTSNSTLQEPKTPTKENFDFAGRYTDKKLKNKYDFSEKVTKNFTLYAKWTKKDTNNVEDWKNPFTDVKKVTGSMMLLNMPMKIV